MFEESLKKSFEFALKAHEKQSKKGTNHPMIYHPMAVASYVLQYGGTTEQACSAILHDTLGTTSYAKMVELFGQNITDGVYAFLDPDLSDEEEALFEEAHEDKKWRILKQSYLNKIKELKDSQKLVIFCEELHDGRELVHDMRHYGPQQTLKRYPLEFQDATKNLYWYYSELQNILKITALPAALKSEFDSMVATLKTWS